MSQPPLAGIRVLDLSRVLAGPWCTQTLGDLGATIIKVEHPKTGDITRQWGPPYLKNSKGQPSAESAYYLAANRNKYGITADFSTHEGQQRIRLLAQEADVVVENFLPGTLAAYELDYTSLHRANPALIYCSITGFGQEGPLRDQAGYDYMIQAMSGLMSITGAPDGEGGVPMRVGIPVADLFTGQAATQAILAALLARATPGHPQFGKGQHLDVALFDVQLTTLANQLMSTLVSGKSPGRIGNRHPTIVPYQIFDTADIPIIIAVGSDRQFRDLCHIMDLADLADDERFSTNPARVSSRNLLEGLLQQRFKAREAAQWLDACRHKGIPAAPILDINQAVQHPQTTARNLIHQVEHPVSGNIPIAAHPVKFSETPLHPPTCPPTRGQHNKLQSFPSPRKKP